MIRTTRINGSPHSCRPCHSSFNEYLVDQHRSLFFWQVWMGYFLKSCSLSRETRVSAFILLVLVSYSTMVAIKSWENLVKGNIPLPGWFLTLSASTFILGCLSHSPLIPERKKRQLIMLSKYWLLMPQRDISMVIYINWKLWRHSENSKSLRPSPISLTTLRQRVHMGPIYVSFNQCWVPVFPFSGGQYHQEGWNSPRLGLSLRRFWKLWELCMPQALYTWVRKLYIIIQSHLYAPQ